MTRFTSGPNAERQTFSRQSYADDYSSPFSLLKFPTEGLITTRSNRMKFRLLDFRDTAPLKLLNSERNTYNRERIIYKNTHNRYYLVGPPPSTLLSVTCPSLHLWPADNTLAKKNYNCLLLSSDRYR